MLKITPLNKRFTSVAYPISFQCQSYYIQLNIPKVTLNHIVYDTSQPLRNLRKKMNDRNGFQYHFNREEDALRRSKRTRNQIVETEDGLPRAKRKTPVSRRRTKAQPRKNRPNKNTREMSLQCCTENTCLLNYDRSIIASIRKDFDSKLYDEQNSYLSSLIDVQPKDKRNRITYNIRDVSGLRKVKVCKTAFLKIFGIGKRRITVLLKKIQPYSGDVQKDQRALTRNAKKLPMPLKAEV